MSQQQVNLSTVLKDRVLVVADYQRPYAWVDKQLLDLWEDLDLLGPHQPHYAGTLVLKPTDEDPLATSSGESLQPHEVVDGQQRLTTCLLLLDRLRRHFEALDGHEDAAEYADGLRRTYGQVRVGGVREPRLRLADDLDTVWRDEILGDQHVASVGEVAGVTRLRHAASFFDKRLVALVDAVDADTAFHRLADLQRRITQGLRFLVYEVESASEVGVIFETLNERGRDLSELEKVKNYLLYLARQLDKDQREALTKKINTKWSLIFKNLSDAPDIAEEVMRAHWLATRDPVLKNWDRTASVKRAFPRSKYVDGSDRLVPTADDDTSAGTLDQLFDDISTYVDQLEQCSVFARDLVVDHPTYPSSWDPADAARARVAMGSLRRTGIVALFRPLLFAARLRHFDDGAFYADLVELCVTYAARVFVIGQLRGNAGLPYLARTAHDLFHGLAPADCLDHVRRRLWVYAPDDYVRGRLEATSNWYVRTSAHKYFLYEYELHLNKGAKGVPDYRTFFDSRHGKSTEHVLPQTPEVDKTTNTFKHWSRFTVEEHQDMHNTLGNLVLTNEDSNSSYGRKSFQDKSGSPQAAHRCYHRGHLHQERLVAQTYGTWSAETIRARQAVLADWAMQRWHVDPPATTTQAADDDAEADEIDAQGFEAEIDDAVELG